MRTRAWWPGLSIRLLASFAFILWGTILFTNTTTHRILTNELPRFELQTMTSNASILAQDLEAVYAQSGQLSVKLLDMPPRLSLRLYAAGGQVLESSTPWPARPDAVRQALANQPSVATIVAASQDRRYGYQVLPLRHEGKTIGALEVTDELPPIGRFLLSIKYDLGISAVIAVGSILAVGMYLVGYFKRNLHEIKKQTEAIVSGDFDRRIAVRSNDEMGQIANCLNRMAEDLQRLAETRNEFLSKVSHELRTPLTVAKGFSSLVRRHEFPPRIERNVAIIDSQLDDLTRLVNDLLDLSRRQHGNMDLRTEDLDCGTLVAEVIEQQRQVLRGQKVVLEAHFRVKQVPIKGDRQRLHQVLGNLIGNASRHCRGRTWLELDADKQQAIIRVCDNGIGIAPEDQARIFEPFFQARKGPRGGAGLGLTVARELVLGHGGTISISSIPDVGTTFTIALPRTDVIAEKAAKARPWPRLFRLRGSRKATPVPSAASTTETLQV